MNGQEQSRDVCEISVIVDNFDGRSSATDLEFLLSTFDLTGKREGSHLPSGWTSQSGERRLNQILEIRKPKLLQDQWATTSSLGYNYEEYLLDEHCSIPKTLSRYGVIGFCIDGFNHAYIAGRVRELPLKDLALNIIIVNREYGTLATRLFSIDYKLWNDLRFTPMD